MFNIARVCQNQGIPGDEEEGGGLIPVRLITRSVLEKRPALQIIIS
jgi:hypothetical protein